MPTYRLNIVSSKDNNRCVINTNITYEGINANVGHIDSKTDSGWKDVLSKITDAHPASALANQYGKKSVKDTQVDRIIHQHRRKKAGKKV